MGFLAAVSSHYAQGVKWQDSLSIFHKGLQRGRLVSPTPYTNPQPQRSKDCFLLGLSFFSNPASLDLSRDTFWASQF